MQLSGFFKGDRTFTQPIVWVTTSFMVAFHVGTVAALFVFSWKAFLLAMVLWWVAGSLGIGMGYHRLLTHRGYKTPKWMEYFLTVCGTLALEGGPIFWVATHRMHHQNTDKKGDPHSPRDGGFWPIWVGSSRGRPCTTIRQGFRLMFLNCVKTSSTRGSVAGIGCRSQSWGRLFSLRVDGSMSCGASSFARSLASIPHGW